MIDLTAKFQNNDHTVGIIKITEKKDLKRLAGYFNKNLLVEMIDLFDLFEVRDMAVFYNEKEDANGIPASLLLLCPNEEKDTFIAVAGKPEFEG